MKRFFACFVLIAAVILQSAVWRYDDFEDGTFGDINVHDLNGDGSNWQVVATTKSKAGGYVARSQSAGLTPDNLMEFPVVYAEFYDQDFNLHFWVGAEDAENYAETYQVYLDFTGPCMGDNSFIIWEETLTSADWKKVEIDLKSFVLENDQWAGEANVYIGIRHFGSENQSALLLDDVMFMSYTFFYFDGTVESLPPSVVEPYSDQYIRLAPYDRTIYSEDWGLFVGYQSVLLHYILSNNEGSQLEQTLEMTPNFSDDFWGTYECTVPGNSMGTFMEYWCVTTDNDGIVTVSDRFNLEWGEVTFEEGFEEYDGTAGWLPEGWVAYRAGEHSGSTWERPWEVGTPRQNTHSGNYSITSASQNNFGVWETENYLVTPRIRINAKDTYLKYHVNAQTIPGEKYRERWSLLISTVEGDGTDIENFTLVKKDSIIPTTDNENTWYEKVLNLAEYENEQIRLMWIHHYTPTDVKLDRFLNLDDISVAELPVVFVADPGNAAMPGDDVVINATATDYSGIASVIIYYTLDGGEELSVLMSDNGDDTFTGAIPGQAHGTRCSWYVVVTDGSPSGNTVTWDKMSVIWFDEGVIEWGSAYNDWPEPMNAGNRAAIDWNMGSKNSLYLNKIEIGLDRAASNLKWRIVEFDGVPTDRVIGTLEGTHSFASGGDGLVIDGDQTQLYGHFALVFEFSAFNEIMLDESGDKSHAWQWNSVTGWNTNDWGAFYIRMHVSQTVGIEEQILASSTELFQNYPNPFNPATSISFYNSVKGDVNLSVYNVKGELVATLVDGLKDKGYSKVDFNASGLNSGVYYYTLRTPEKTMTKKMVLVK